MEVMSSPEGQLLLVPQSNVPTLRFFINGRWEDPTGRASAAVTNPATGKTIAQVLFANAQDVARAAATAQQAFLQWREVPAAERVQVLFRYKTLLEQSQSSLSRLVCEESGKTIEEARNSVRRGIQLVDEACAAPALLLADAVESPARATDRNILRQPLGVCAGITPFQHPAMLPLSMFPLAIACGNSFVLKPSEKVPQTPVRLAELLDEAGLPKGVFQLIHGPGEVASALIAQPQVRAIAFAGSTAAARDVSQLAAIHGKRIRAAGGGRHHIVIMPDADPSKAVDAIISAAFGGCGEYSLAGCVAILVGDIAEPLIDQILFRTAALQVGDGMRGGMDMGPQVTAAHRLRVLGFIEKGIEQGAKLLRDGRQITYEREGGYYLGPTIFDNVAPAMSLAQEEVPGPVLPLMRAASMEDAIDAINAVAVGSIASIFTSNGKTGREFSRRVEREQVGINTTEAQVSMRDLVRFYTGQKTVSSRWF
jgi:malonate-semialdehyde dehydrogenase (acetylating)/methylmalonate-semialdehyde dehydrogenase